MIWVFIRDDYTLTSNSETLPVIILEVPVEYENLKKKSGSFEPLNK
jgi:hypothetical protein